MTRARRAEQITLRGLNLTSPFGRFRKPITTLVAPQSTAQQSTAHPPAPFRPHIDKPFDLIVLACRAHRMREAIEQMTAPHAINSATVILSLIDGGPHVPAIKRILPLNTVLEGMLEARADINAPTLRCAVRAVTQPDEVADVA